MILNLVTIFFFFFGKKTDCITTNLLQGGFVGGSQGDLQASGRFWIHAFKIRWETFGIWGHGKKYTGHTGHTGQ